MPHSKRSKKKIRSDSRIYYYLKSLNKRGHSFDEMEDMPIILFNTLCVFDNIELSGARVEQIRHAQVMEGLYKSSGNLTKQGMKDMSISDFDMGGLISGKSLEERIEDENKKKHAAMLRLFSGLEDKNNGK